MSIEYFCNPTDPIDDIDLESMLTSLAMLPGVLVVRRTEKELGLGMNGSSTQEDVTINAKSKEIYVGFHSASRGQREALLQELRQSLLKVGCEATFGEE